MIKRDLKRRDKFTYLAEDIVVKLHAIFIRIAAFIPLQFT